LSAVKVSNADMNGRLRMTEGEMHGLQSRVDRLEVERC
jgi:hypothetical protein